MDTVHIIKGSPGGPEGKWEEVQAIQHEPFIYIHYNGSRWAGQEEGDIAELIEMMNKYKLRDDDYPCWSKNPCRGIDNPEYPKGPRYIDGPRLYACDGVVRFSGNFEEYSHAFCVDTNHEPTISALMMAIQANNRLAVQS